MSADILDELELMRFTRIDPIRENAILKRAKDEIGRLRGEVAMTEQQKADRDLLLTGTSFMRDGKRIDPATVRIETPAPAMPNGVEVEGFALNLAVADGALRKVAEICPVTPPEVASLRAVIVGARAWLRAADNRDAAGVDRPAPGDCSHYFPMDPRVCVRCGWDFRTGEPPAPAAVPAGEAVASDDARLHAATLRGISSHLRACPPYEKLRGDADCIDAAADFIMRTPQEGEQNTSRWPLLDRVEFALRDAGFDYDEAFRIAHMAAHPSACELGAVRELVARWRQRWESLIDRGRLGDGYRVAGNNVKLCADELEAALQHRGDSQEVGRG